MDKGSDNVTDARADNFDVEDKDRDNSQDNNVNKVSNSNNSNRPPFLLSHKELNHFPLMMRSLS